MSVTCRLGETARPIATRSIAVAAATVMPRRCSTSRRADDAAISATGIETSAAIQSQALFILLVSVGRGRALHGQHRAAQPLIHTAHQMRGPDEQHLNDAVDQLIEEPRSIAKRYKRRRTRADVSR